MISWEIFSDTGKVVKNRLGTIVPIVQSRGIGQTCIVFLVGLVSLVFLVVYLASERFSASFEIPAVAMVLPTSAKNLPVSSTSTLTPSSEN